MKPRPKDAGGDHFDAVASAKKLANRLCDIYHGDTDSSSGFLGSVFEETLAKALREVYERGSTVASAGVVRATIRGGPAAAARPEYKTTTSGRYTPDEDDTPQPEAPDGDGWRLVAAAATSGGGIRYHWFWERAAPPGAEGRGGGRPT